jgi:hypothetical protein
LDPTPGLIEAATSAGGARPGVCPECGTAAPALPAVVSALLPGARLHRCAECSAVWAGPAPARRVSRCGRCRLPLAAGSEESAACPACGDAGAAALPPVDRSVVDAAEREVRLALAATLSFVESPELTAYLERVARQQARAIDRAIPAPAVRTFEDPALRTLALPSGTLLVSHGALASVEDEAELAFLLGHELAHVASGEAGAAIVSLGLLAVAADERGGDRTAWSAAARTVMQLGHGDDREHAADAQAHAALAASGYETEAALDYLDRLGARMDRGEAELAELGLAHPRPADRRRRLLALDRAPEGQGRVDREVFRRVAGREVLARTLRPARPFAEEAGTASGARRLLRAVPLPVWIVLGLVASGVALLIAL